MRRKILMIDVGGWGGITHYTYNLMQALAECKEIEVALLTNKDYELDHLPKKFSIFKVPLLGQSYLRTIHNIFSVIFCYKPQIIHIQTMVSARKDWFWFMLAKLIGKKIILTCHNVLPHEDIEKNAFFMKTAFRIIYSSAEKIIAHSQYSRNRLNNFFQIDLAKIVIIPHGNYLFFRKQELSPKEARKKLSIAEDKKVIINFGALRYYKGVDDLLCALDLLRKKRDNVLLILAGKPMHVPENYFEKLIEQKQLTDYVLFKKGYISFEDIAVLFFASDLAVFPYQEIDTSGSLQLAYAFAKPVVATKTGSMPEVIEDGVNGILVEPGNVQALAEAMEKILFNSDITSMSEACFHLAKERFSWDLIAQKTEQLYKEIKI
ncbi:MAG: glycosyltransferase family 4 protein [Candidatus Omnitrophica bacterium]|nr:glycosyltransferase family 4 protein [Candidatus Omnitrophota bacterium]